MHIIRIRATRTWLGRKEDREELFIKQTLARWLRRYIQHMIVLDEPDLELAFWCLGWRTKNLIEFLSGRLHGTDTEEQRHALLKAMGAPEDLPCCVLETLNYQPPSMVSSFLRTIEHHLMAVEEQPLRGKKSNLEINFVRFSRLFDLDRHESELCLLFYLMKAHRQATAWLDRHLELDQLSGRNSLSHILGVGLGTLNSIITGKLSKIGILSHTGIFLQLDDDFLPYLLNPFAEIAPDKLFRKALAPDVPLSYHLLRKEEVGHIRTLLKKKRPSPCHVLLYGHPGTGKTSFARALVRELSVDAYEIIKPTEQRNSAGANRAAIMACLNITNRGEGSVIIMDEADGLLNTATAWTLHGETHDKGWLNQLMDEQGVRMIWITNSIDGIEDSVIRRFAYSLHFRMFNRRQRCRLWEQVLRRHRVKRFFNSREIQCLAGRYNVSAGVMDLAVRKAVDCYPQNKTSLKLGIEMSLKAHEILTQGGTHTVRQDQMEAGYSLEGLNVRGDLEDMIQRVEAYSELLRGDPARVSMSMNLLFYGPPGTGKSELARHLAHRLDRELMVRRASDILSPYVGMTEKALAAAFAQAEDKEAVLVIDEADSMLFGRDQAKRSWEVSFTNEFLTQMERFRGILICTTNRLASLDSASLRRFQEKIGFDYLTPEGNVIFYKKLLDSLASGGLDKSCKAKLRSLSNLAPGDFKVVRDRNLLCAKSKPHPAELVAQLARESEIKHTQFENKIIGF